MAKRKQVSKRTGGNNLLTFFAIILVLALIALIAAYFMTDSTDEKTKPSATQTETQPQPQIVAPFEGTWASTYNGALLSIKGTTVAVEQPGVDKSPVIKGKINIENNIVTFVYESGTCKGIKGQYKYTLNDKGELFFKLIKDNCPSRQELMSASWFKF